MVRWPAGLHQLAGSLPNRGQVSGRTVVTPQHTFSRTVRAPIGNGTGQAIVSSGGGALVTVGPAGLGCRWYPSQIQVSTSTGPSDLSSCVLYKLFVDPKQQIGQTLQGGGDTIGWTAEMQPGELVFAVWENANPGDLATLAIMGDQVVLT
jgi:hypothetical protein